MIILHCNWQLYVIHVILLSCWQLLLYQVILSRAGHYLRFYQDMAISQLEKMALSLNIFMLDLFLQFGVQMLMQYIIDVFCNKLAGNFVQGTWGRGGENRF